MTERVSDSALAARILDVVEHDIVPLTQAGVASGNKLFGAAILLKRDLSLIAACPPGERQALEERVEELGAVYAGLSATYQAGKPGSGIPLG